MTRVMLIKIGKVSNISAVVDGSDNGNVGKVGKISNFGAIRDSSDKGNVGKVKLVKLSILVP